MATYPRTLAQAATTDLSGTYVQYFNVRGYGAVGDGITDDSAAIQAAIDAAEATAGGGTVYFPTGNYLIGTTLVAQGATALDGWSAKSGIYFAGAAMKSSILTTASGITLMQWGVAAAKVGMGLRDLTLKGPGKAVSGGIGLDSRTTGGSYTFDTIHVDGFEIGIREHDNTLVDARSVNVRNCGTGWALGYFSDAHSFVGCRADSCDVGYWVGYWDTTQGESAQTESHGLTWLGGMSNLCGVGVYIHGSAVEAISIIGTYFEQYSDVAIRVGYADGSSSVSAGIEIKGYFSGNRLVDPIGKVAHAIEINNAKAVRIYGSGFRNHTTASINVRNTGAQVLIEPGNFNRTSGESDVKLPDASLINVGKERPLTVGRRSSRTINRATSTPTATADYDGAELNVSGVLYRCGSNGAGGYAWYAQPTALAMASMGAVPSIWLGAGQLEAGTGSPTRALQWTRWMAWAMVDGSNNGVISTFRVPIDWATVNVDIHWSRTDTATGNVRFNAYIANVATGADLTTGSVGNSPEPAVPAQNVLAVTRAHSGATVTPGSTQSFRIYREGGNANDTYTGTVQLIGITISKAS